VIPEGLHDSFQDFYLDWESIWDNATSATPFVSDMLQCIVDCCPVWNVIILRLSALERLFGIVLFPLLMACESLCDCGWNKNERCIGWPIRNMLDFDHFDASM
jgi:hypothetical protein